MAKRTKTATKGRAAKPAKKATVALVKRAPAAVRLKRVDVLPPEALTPRSVTDDIMIGDLGLVEVQLTEKEEAVLAEPVNLRDIMVKPTGQPYLPHQVYTRWLNRAVGRFGWAMVPIAKPQKSASGKKITVVAPYILYIHGKPVKFAWGEQDYYEDNKEQTFGDALESTVASGLRRLCKRMGVGLEMWDRSYLEAFLREHCVHVQIEQKQKDGGFEKKWVWRLKRGPAFFNEVGGRGTKRRTDDAGEQQQETRRTVPGEERASHGAEQEPISLSQRQRLAMVINNSDRSDAEVADWLREFYGINNPKPTREIRRVDYDPICRAIEAPGALPKGRAR